VQLVKEQVNTDVLQILLIVSTKIVLIQ